MHRADFYNDLCLWDFLYIAPGAVEATEARCELLHERHETQSIVVDAVLRKSARGGFSSLTAREQEIIQAYSRGADLPV